MAIPSKADSALAEIDALHGVIMVRCRTFLRAGKRRDPASTKDALRAYVDAVSEFVAGAD